LPQHRTPLENKKGDDIMKKRFVVLLLALTLILAMDLPVFAAVHNYLDRANRWDVSGSTPYHDADDRDSSASITSSSTIGGYTYYDGGGYSYSVGNSTYYNFDGYTITATPNGAYTNYFCSDGSQGIGYWYNDEYKCFWW